MIYHLTTLILSISNVTLVIIAIILIEYSRRTIKNIIIDILETVSRIHMLEYDKKKQYEHLAIEIDNAKQRLADHRLQLRMYISNQAIFGRKSRRIIEANWTANWTAKKYSGQLC